jgi:hypothetical protein
MSTIIELALGHQVADLGKIAIQLLRLCIPEGEPADSRQVSQISPARQRE